MVSILVQMNRTERCGGAAYHTLGTVTIRRPQSCLRIDKNLHGESDPMQRTLGLCSWSLQSGSVKELFDRTLQCSINAIQIALDPVDSGVMSLEELCGSCADTNIQLISGMMQTVGEEYISLETIKATGGLRPDEHWETNKAAAKRQASIANQLGLNLVTLHAGYIEEGPQLQTMIDRIKFIADIFAEHSIRLGLETGQEHAGTLMDILDSPGMEHIGVNFDPANMILYNMGDSIKAMNMLKDRIVQVHMKDAFPTSNPGQWGTEVQAGYGSVDWGSFFEIVTQLPNSVAVVIEREAGDQRVEDIRAARELAMSYGVGT